MELENINVPADKQYQKIVDTEYYIQYLGDCVEVGAISEEMAEEIIKNEDWQKVIDLIDEGDFYANSQEEDEEPLHN